MRETATDPRRLPYLEKREAHASYRKTTTRPRDCARDPGKASEIGASARTTNCKGEEIAMDMVINLIIQLISGVVGGNAVGAAMKDYSLGNPWQQRSRARLAASAAVSFCRPRSRRSRARLAATSMSEPSSAKLSAAAAGGAILTLIAGLVKSMMASQQTR
jgi:hypothetical protein